MPHTFGKSRQKKRHGTSRFFVFYAKQKINLTWPYVNKINNIEEMLNKDIFRPYRFRKQQKIFEKVSNEFSFNMFNVTHRYRSSLHMKIV